MREPRLTEARLRDDSAPAPYVLERSGIDDSREDARDEPRTTRRGLWR